MPIKKNTILLTLLFVISHKTIIPIQVLFNTDDEKKLIIVISDKKNECHIIKKENEPIHIVFFEKHFFGKKIVENGKTEFINKALYTIFSCIPLLESPQYLVNPLIHYFKNNTCN